MTAAEQSPFLGHFRTPFPRLTGAGDRNLGETFERLAGLLGGSQAGATITFAVVSSGDLEAGPAESWSLRLGEDRTTVDTRRPARPDLEIVVGEDTWWRLAEGTESPLEAFGRGRMLVRGDLRVARRFAGLLERAH